MAKLRNVFWHVLSGVAVTIGFIVALLFLAMILGPIFDGVDQYDEQKVRCLKHANNGEEVQRCH